MKNSLGARPTIPRSILGFWRGVIIWIVSICAIQGITLTFANRGCFYEYWVNVRTQVCERDFSYARGKNYNEVFDVHQMPFVFPLILSILFSAGLWRVFNVSYRMPVSYIINSENLDKALEYIEKIEYLESFEYLKFTELINELSNRELEFSNQKKVLLVVYKNALSSLEIIQNKSLELSDNIS